MGLELSHQQVALFSYLEQYITEIISFCTCRLLQQSRNYMAFLNPCKFCDIKMVEAISLSFCMLLLVVINDIAIDMILAAV